MRIIRFTLSSLALVAALGLIVTLSKCKKDNHPIVVNTYTVSGLCTYPSETSTSTFIPAPGAVLQIFAGSDPTALATTYADASGNYKFIGLLPGAYTIQAKLNTANQNYKAIDGINFSANITITLATSNLTQPIALGNIAAVGHRILTTTKSDTIGSHGAKAYVPMEIHSKLEFNTTFTGTAINGPAGMAFQGGFTSYSTGIPNDPANYGWGLKAFYFDEANPNNDTIIGYALLSHVTTFEATRDSLRSGCVKKTLQVDTFNVGVSGNTYNVGAVPKTDTAWFIAIGNSIEKYGAGYVAHGKMTAFYKSANNEIEPPRVTACALDSSSYNGTGPSYLGPYSTKITNNVDMYFEFQGINQAWNAAHSSFNNYAIFEGQFDFNRSDYYLKVTDLANTIHVTPHIELEGASNQNF